MVLPGKTVDYKTSVISKFPIVLKILTEEKFCKLNELQERTKDVFSSIAEFVQALDCLFALGKIGLMKIKMGFLYACRTAKRCF